MSEPRVDVYSPWSDPPERLTARHVAREEELTVLLSSVRSFLAGGRPLPIYLFGPRGVGKSHLLTLMRLRLQAELERSAARLTTIPEDIPLQGTPEGILRRIAQSASTAPAWTTWRGLPAGVDMDEAETLHIVLFEGLDRQLAALDVHGRRRLRHALTERPELYLIATGISLPSELITANAAFYGAFDPRPLGPLDEAAARQLLSTCAGRPHDAEPSKWTVRRDALVALAGGNPRALVAIGRALRQRPDARAVDGLLHVLQDFTAHYQLRFRDLSPMAQRIVALMAAAPRQLRPKEVSELLGESQPAVSTTTARLERDGVLRRHRAGRETHLELTEPLFRFWLEYRTAPWEHTRVEWLGRLLEALLSARDLAATWWESEDETLRRASSRALVGDAKATGLAYDRLGRAVKNALVRADLESAQALLSRLVELPRTPMDLYFFLTDLARANVDLLVCEPVRVATKAVAIVHLAITFVREVRQAERSPRAAFRVLVAGAAGCADGSSWPWLCALEIVVVTLRSLDPRGRAWRLTDGEQRKLAELPYFAVHFSQGGKRPNDPPLVSADAWAQTQLDPTRSDLGELLGPAIRAQNATLFGRISDLLAAGHGNLPTSPRPGQATGQFDDCIARVFSATLGLTDLTWAASLAGAGEEAFEHAVEALAVPRVFLLPESNQLALVGLGVRSPARLERVLDAISDKVPMLAARVPALVGQLEERARGQLHPELAAVWEAVRHDMFA